MTKQTGVYAIKHKVSGKVYVGSAAVSITRRWDVHRRGLRSDKHPNKHLQAAWNKDGEQSFEFFVLEECLSDDCVSREQHWIDLLKATSRRFGYNMVARAGSRRGTTATEQTRARQSAAIKGKKHTPETKSKMSATRKGRKMPPRSAEHCAKISASKKGRKTKPLNAEGRANLSKALKGKKKSPEARRNMSKAQLGRGKKLVEAQAREIKRRYNLGGDGNGPTALAREFGVSPALVVNIGQGIAWKGL